MSDSTFKYCRIFFSLIVLALSVTNIILSFFNPNKCNYIDKIGLDVSDYLLGLGISGLITSIFLFVSFYRKMKHIAILIVMILNSLFSIIWLIIGGIILFEENMECIKNGTSYVIYALVMWCLSSLNFYQGYDF